MTLCGCRKAPRSKCFSAIGKNSDRYVEHVAEIPAQVLNSSGSFPASVTFSWNRARIFCCQAECLSSSYTCTEIIQNDWCGCYMLLLLIFNLKIYIKWKSFLNENHCERSLAVCCGKVPRQKSTYFSDRLLVDAKLLYNGEVFSTCSLCRKSSFEFHRHCKKKLRRRGCFSARPSWKRNKWTVVEQPLKIH